MIEMFGSTGVTERVTVPIYQEKAFSPDGDAEMSKQTFENKSEGSLQTMTFPRATRQRSIQQYPSASSTQYSSAFRVKS